MDGLKEADALLRRGLSSEAEQVLRRVLEFAPLEGKAWHLLGKVLQRSGRHREALDCFTEAERCYSCNHRESQPPASLRLAKILWSQGDVKAAVAMLGALRRKQPQEERLRDLQDAWLRQLEREK